VTADVAITGASGLVGGHLLRALVADGQRPRAIVRSAAAAEKVSEDGAEPIVADLFDQTALRDALWGVPLVYHVAGVNEACPRDPAAMDRVNIDGTVSLIEAAADAGVGRIVYTSSAAAIGEGEGMVGTERTANSGEYLSPYARSKHLAEIAAFETSAARAIDLVAVNPSSVQGPGRAAGSAKILLYALRSRRPYLVDTDVSIVDIEDCTAGHVAASTHGRAGERYLLSGASVSVGEAAELASSVSGLAIEPRWLSKGVARSVGRPLSAVLARVRPGSDVCPALVDTLLHGHRFDGSRAVRDLGITYTPLEDTFRRTIGWFLAEGLIART
jgi:dihydroflavonol-4-reductase